MAVTLENANLLLVLVHKQILLCGMSNEKHQAMNGG
jgi:hypothetical protein